MIVAYDGNKARKATSIWLEIDVMSVANTIRFLKKNVDVMLQKCGDPPPSLLWFCPHLALTRFQNMSRTCCESNCGFFSRTHVEKPGQKNSIGCLLAI